METNTVCISIEEYVELRDFKREITNGNYLVIEEVCYPFGCKKTIFYSESEVIRKCEEKQNALLYENEKMKTLAECIDMSRKHDIETYKYSLKNMSFIRKIKFVFGG